VSNRRSRFDYDTRRFVSQDHGLFDNEISDAAVHIIMYVTSANADVAELYPNIVRPKNLINRYITDCDFLG